MPQSTNTIFLGIDFGQKVIGLAKFNTHEDLAPYPLGRIINRNMQQVLSELTSLIEEESINCIVIGHPVFTDGKSTRMSLLVESFAKEIKKEVETIPIYLQDESLTTFEAERRMKESPQFNFKVDKKKIDELSAVIILEEFLDEEDFWSDKELSLSEKDTK